MRHPVQPTTPQSEAAARAPAAALATAGRVRAAALATAALAVTAALLAGPLYAGTPRLQMFFGSTFSDQAYSKKVYDRVAGAWTRPAETPKEGVKAVVITAILRDGKAPQQTLHLSSGSKAWDDAALAAVKKAAPFDPLPKSYSGSSIEVHFHFEYAK